MEMYDDYDLDFTFCNDMNLDEDTYYEYNAQELDLDEDYDRGSEDYQDLAYRHYAWYNISIAHHILMVSQKHKVQVTLDIECYDDLDLKNLDWNRLLKLEGDEVVHYVMVKEDEVFCWWSMGLFY